MNERIRSQITAHGRLAKGVGDLGDHDDLYAAGLTSHASVDLMLALEDEFDVEFPERMLRHQTFESVAAIRAALTELTSA